MNRVVFISVLMLISLTAAARHRGAGFVVADTAVKPGPKGPLAEKLETKAVKPAAAVKKTPTVKKAPAASATPVKKLPASKANTTTKKAVTTKTATSKSRPRKPKKGIGIELFTPLTFKYAILLDVPVEKVTDEKLLEVLEHWYGTRYRYGGKSRKGIDCSAFTQAFMTSYFDYKLPRTAEEQYTASKRIKKKKLRQGDLVFFKTRGPKGGITHVGVYLMNNRFVHSATSTGVRISNLNEDYYKAKYAGAGRIK